MLALVVTSVLASALSSAPDADVRRPPEVRATATATVRLISSATVHWDSLNDQNLPPPRDTTLTIEHRPVDAKIIEFQ